jgi:predicted GTPase
LLEENGIKVFNENQLEDLKKFIKENRWKHKLSNLCF